MSGDNRTQPQRPAFPPRVEYVDYRTCGESREFRLSLLTPQGSIDVRFRIAAAAFAASRVLLQDGPDVCYQLLLRMLANGDTPGGDVVTVDTAELVAYRDAHTPAPRRQAPPGQPPRRTPTPRTQAPQTRPKLPVAAPPVPSEAAPAFGEGQRVRHAVFGDGVTTGSRGGHTSVQFDEHGTRTFVTRMLELETLSPPHTWQAGPHGKNRPRS